MFIRLFIAVVALIGIMAFLGWYGKASPAQRNNAIKQIILYGVGIALLLLVVTGRASPLFAIFAAIIPFWHKLSRARNLLGMFQNMTGTKFSNTSFTTKWLLVQFDLISRAMDAEILQGNFAGKQLSQLSETEILTLLQACQADKQSVIAINAFMRAKKSGWQHGGETGQQSHANQDTNPSQMSHQQALEILGLEANASQADISKRHKTLMQKLHPDRGGSSYLATQINLAKDTLSQSS